MRTKQRNYLIFSIIGLLILSIVFIWFKPRFLPEEYEDHIKNKDRCDLLYKGEFRDFFVGQSSINDIVEKNKDKKYMHIFFIADSDKENPADLKLLFRFSNIETFYSANFNIDFSSDPTGKRKENAYKLQADGTFIPEINTPTSVSLQKLSENYADGNIGKFLIRPNLKDIKITQYITYKMANILKFKEFEKDLKFEVTAPKDKNSKIRLGLDVYIKDLDRVHHYENIIFNPVYEGYYDLGNLKP